MRQFFDAIIREKTYHCKEVQELLNETQRLMMQLDTTLGDIYSTRFSLAKMNAHYNDLDKSMLDEDAAKNSPAEKKKP
jgi:hypothetical protein